MPGTLVDGSLYVEFNSTKPLIFYSLFPGQQMFLSVYHPTVSLEGKRVEGSAFFKLNLAPKVTSLLPDQRSCQAVENNFLAFAKAHKECDYWYEMPSNKPPQGIAPPPLTMLLECPYKPNIKPSFKKKTPLFKILF